MNEQELRRLQEQVEKISAALQPPADLPSAGSIRVPSTTEFVLSEEFLGKETLFPNQALLLKLMFLESEALTRYDLKVLERWCSGFELGEIDTLLGGRYFEPAADRDLAMGTTPDVLHRLEALRRRGRPCVEHMNIIAGRRAGKGELAGMAIAYHLYQTIALVEPQPYVNAARGKTLTVDIFAGTQDQARETIFSDVVRAVVNAPCFRQYLVALTRDRLVLATPYDRSLSADGGIGTIEVIARETTVLAGRGQTSICMAFDEMSFVDPSNSRTSADVLYAAATPALYQSRDRSLTLTVSSPYQQIGRFYELHRQACQVDEVSGEALYPEMITVQLPSWEPYAGAETAESLPLTTREAAGDAPWFWIDDHTIRTFPATGGAPVVRGPELQQVERSDPKRFRVEVAGQWAPAQSAFLEERWIKRIFSSPFEAPLRAQSAGRLNHDYVLHLDPSSSHDATAYVIAHAEELDGTLYVIVDQLRRWLPEPGEDIALDPIYAQLHDDIEAFEPTVISVDQHGAVFVRHQLEKIVQRVGVRKRASVEKFDHTRSANLAIAELMREAVQAGRVRSFPHRQLELELTYLIEDNKGAHAPTTGPVTTDDLAIALMVTTSHLLADTSNIGSELGALGVSGSPGYSDPTHEALSAVHRPRRGPAAALNPARFGRGHPSRGHRR